MVNIHLQPGFDVCYLRLSLYTVAVYLVKDADDSLAMVFLTRPCSIPGQVFSQFEVQFGLLHVYLDQFHLDLIANPVHFFGVIAHQNQLLVIEDIIIINQR